VKHFSLTQRRGGATKNEKKKSVTENEVAKKVLDAAFLIHRALEPSLLGTVYEIILAKKLI
jgi:hypothetical protein